jgi:hypothetical protein
MRNYLLAAALAPSLLFAQTIDLEWPNQPCATLLQCDTGCTACNMAENSSPGFMGTNLGREGIDICPQPTDDHRLFVSFLAFTPIHIDSIIVHHRSLVDGPQRLRLSVGMNGAEPVMMSDAPTLATFSSTVITDAGCVEAGTGMAYGIAQLVLQAYEGYGGDWDLDAIRVVGSACTANGITELGPTIVPDDVQARDVLGRPVGAYPSSGAYISGRRQVIVR